MSATSRSDHESNHGPRSSLSAARDRGAGRGVDPRSRRYGEAAVEADHDRRRRVPAGPQQPDHRRQRRVDRHDRRARPGARLQAPARLLVPAVDLRQGLHGHRRRARSPSTARSAPTRSGPTACRSPSNDFKFTYDTIMNKKNNVVTRDGYDKITRVQRDQPHRVPDGVQERLRAVPRAVGEHEHDGAAEARPRGPELQQGLEQLHLRSRRPRSRSAAGRCWCSRSRPTSRSRWSRTRTTGAGSRAGAEGRVHPVA